MEGPAEEPAEEPEEAPAEEPVQEPLETAAPDDVALVLPPLPRPVLRLRIKSYTRSNLVAAARMSWASLEATDLDSVLAGSASDDAQVVDDDFGHDAAVLQAQVVVHRHTET